MKFKICRVIYRWIRNLTLIKLFKETYTWKWSHFDIMACEDEHKNNSLKYIWYLGLQTWGLLTKKILCHTIWLLLFYYREMWEFSFWFNVISLHTCTSLFRYMLYKIEYSLLWFGTMCFPNPHSTLSVRTILPTTWFQKTSWWRRN